MSKLNINELRKDTIGCQQILHFNNAGAALQPKPVIAAIKHHLDLEALIGGYEAAEAIKNEIDLFYDLAARLINCSRDEIAYTSNATHAWNMIFYSLDFKIKRTLKGLALSPSLWMPVWMGPLDLGELDLFFW